MSVLKSTITINGYHWLDGEIYCYQAEQSIVIVKLHDEQETELFSLYKTLDEVVNFFQCDDDNLEEIPF